LSLDIYAGEILAVLGPSGCGKTTLLQMIAGLERPDEGSVIIGNQIVSSIKENIFFSPDKRQIALVFQNYALWPHYDVFGNVAYPLRIKRIKKIELQKEVERALSLVQLNGMENRYPHELSGGEQQRVALARALVMKPRLLLLDEPLSNLDAKLREEMQYEIKRIQRETGLTIVHVTHDQYEAMGIADRIAVMNQGKLVQVGTPKKVYDNPKTEFVAEFIGKTNLIYSRVSQNNGKRLLKLADGIEVEDNYMSNASAGDGLLSIRPEDIILDRNKGIIEGEIVKVVYRGNIIDYDLLIGDRVLNVQTSPQEHFEVGERVWFALRRATTVRCNKKL